MSEKYQKHKDTIKSYQQAHRLQINEQNRRRYGGNEMKLFSFCRDILDQLKYLSDVDLMKKNINDIISNLKLTPLQRTIIQFHNQGLSQDQIAESLQVNQSSICKTLNGNFDLKRQKKQGGIYKKFLRYLAQHPEVNQQISQLSVGHLLGPAWAALNLEIPFSYRPTRAQLEQEIQSLKKQLQERQ